MYRSPPRTPVEVVEESTQQATALMLFVAHALEEAGFSISTSDWPRLVVRVAERSLVLGVGAAALDDKQLDVIADHLRSCLMLLGAS